MPLISVQRDPAGMGPIDRNEVADGQNLIDWMIDNLPIDMGGLHFSVAVNGAVLCATWQNTPDECNAALDRDLTPWDHVAIIVRPQGLDPFTVILIAAVVVSAALVITLVPKPPVALNDNDPNSNNQLNSAGNSYRPRQAIPDISGEIVAYPDFAQPSYYYYEDNKRIFNELFIIGVGQYYVEDLKEGEVPFFDLPYSSTIYNPGDVIPEQLNATINEDTIDVDLIPPGSALPPVGPYDGTTTSPSVVVLSPPGSVAASGIQVGEAVNCLLVGVVGGQPVQIQDDYQITNITGEAVTLLGLNAPVQAGWSVRFIRYQRPDALPWFRTIEATQVWINVKMPSGIRKGDGSTSEVNYSMIVERLNADGTPSGQKWAKAAEFTGNTQAAQYQTTRFEGLPLAKYRVQVARLSLSLGDNAADLMTLDGIAAITTYTPAFGDVTALSIIRRTTQRVNRGASTKISCKVTRKLRIFNQATGQLGADYIPTRRFCDWAFYLLHERMGVAIANIDTAALFGIFDNLPDDQLGYFDFTFDDRKVSARDRLEVCCNVARVRFYNEGLRWHFVREQLQPVRQALFNRRNLKGGASKFTQQFRQPNAYDSVIVRYVDPVKNVQLSIAKRVTSTGFIDGEGNDPLEIELQGCRNELQARNRLELEVRRLVYSRIIVTDTALNDAQLVRLGDRVDWCDIYDSTVFNGEITGIQGDIYATSERFTPENGAAYWVYITDGDGEPTATVRAYPVPGNLFAFRAPGLTGAYIAGGVVQLGSRYVIATDSNMAASSFVVIRKGKPDDLGAVSIELSEYNPLLFAAD